MVMTPSEALAKSRKVRRTAVSFAARDWRLLFRAWLRLLGTSIALCVRPALRSTESSFPTGVARTCRGDALWEVIGRFERAVRVASHAFPRRPRCLVRSLVLGKLLAEGGVSARLRIGVRRDKVGLEAHAWLEFDDRPIGEAEGIDQKYAPLVPGKLQP